jgi:hypothetical protein
MNRPDRRRHPDTCKRCASPAPGGAFAWLREQMRLEREIEELNALRDEDGASRAG